MKGKTKCQTRYDEAFFRESIQTLSSNEFTNESFATQVIHDIRERSVSMGHDTGGFKFVRRKPTPRQINRENSERIHLILL